MLAGSEYRITKMGMELPQLSDAAERYTQFFRLIRKYPDARHVFSGGSGSLLNSRFRSADLARIILREQGFDTEKIIFERDSRNTYENGQTNPKSKHISSESFIQSNIA